MSRVSVPIPVVVSGTALTCLSLILLSLLFPHAGALVVLLTSLMLGLASAGMAAIFYYSAAGQAREMRRSMETLLRPSHDWNFTPSDDEMGALASSLQLSARQVRVMVETVQRESSRLEAILSSMVEAVVAVDPLLRITFVNRAFAELMGVALPITPGVPLVQVARDHAFLEMCTSALDSGESQQKRLILAAAGARSFDVQVAPLTGDAHRGAIAMLYDVTEIERLERIRRDFVANVSHELRTPLAAVTGYAETLLEGALEDGENGRKFVEIILAKARQLNNICTDLLVLSSLESGKAPVPEPVSLRESIQNALHTVEPVARNRGVRLICGAFDDSSVLGHEVRLEQVFVNLLENAIKFNRPDGEVRVDVARSNGHIAIHVRDTGLGIPSRDLPRIFERFYRVDKARSRATGGTGLGLAIVKHAVEQMGGSVSVESRLGQGSVFTIALPPAENNVSAN
ncbi:MAG TPA: ATP-binding protein [Candidatus Sulfopaludibacter sp.]|jgi:two-component system phosphate regulon sensor histidine kinase PhoR|nr:ATP-binding protein [Candidatus Sulfopaludibacter sp.]